MIEWLVHRLFWWTKLRNAIFDEVHMYDKVKAAMDEKIPGSAFWNDGDGWRSWSFSEDRNKYYFNDIPEQNLSEAMIYVWESHGPEFDLDEVW